MSTHEAGDLRTAMAAEAASVPVLRAAARRLAEDARLDDEQVAAVELAVTEAVTNAVVHAFVGRAPGTVTLAGHVEDGRLVIEVGDDGRGFAPRIDSPGLGLGLPLLGRVCAHFDVGSGVDGEGTRVTMVFDAPHLRGGDPRLRARLDQVLGQIDDAITVSDAAGKMVYANAAAVRLLGASDPDEITGNPSRELADRFAITLPDGRPVALEDLPDQRLLAGDLRPDPLLTRSVHLASGRSRWLLTSASPLADDLAAGQRLAVNVIRDVTAETDARRRQALLVEAGDVLADARDVVGALQRLATLVVGELADWCAVDLADPRGVLHRVALAHRDREKTRLGWEIDRRFPADPETDGGGHAVLRSGTPLFIADLPDEMLAEGISDPDHLALLRAVGMRSILLVPMRVDDEALGVLTLVTADSSRRLDDDMVPFAGAIARRAALAVDAGRRSSG